MQARSGVLLPATFASEVVDSEHYRRCPWDVKFYILQPIHVNRRLCMKRIDPRCDEIVRRQKSSGDATATDVEQGRMLLHVLLVLGSDKLSGQTTSSPYL